MDDLGLFAGGYNVSVHLLVIVNLGSFTVLLCVLLAMANLGSFTG